MTFKGLLVIFLSLGLTSGTYIDLFAPNNSCPVIWTSNISGVGSLRISADGNYIVVGYSSYGGPSTNGNSSVAMFSGNSSRPLWAYSTGINEFVDQSPSAVSLSDDGAYISTGGNIGQYPASMAVLGRSGSVPLWTFRPAFDPAATTRFGQPYVASAISGNGEYVAAHAMLAGTTGSVSSIIIMFRRSSGTPLWFHNTTDYTHPTDLAPISLSYEGAYLATIDPLTHTLYMFSQHDNQTLWTGKGSWNTVMISGTGDFVATGNNTTVKIFGKDSNTTLLSITASSIYLSDFSRDGSTVVAITDPNDSNSTLHLYDRFTGKELFNASPAPDVDMASVSSDGSETAAVTEPGGLFVYTRSGSLICRTKQGSGNRTLVAISGDGRFVVTGNSQLTYMEVASPNQTPYILAIVAGTASAAAAAVFLTLLTIRVKRRHRGVSASSGTI